ncbi:hypothetical protein J7E49_14005 [Variovorax paradoxus]|nr:hypothetical protein [Variovorax paradoxus]
MRRGASESLGRAPLSPVLQWGAFTMQAAVVRGATADPAIAHTPWVFRSMPDVPTVAESGIPGFELLSWYGVWGPANMPAAVTQRLNAEISKAVDAPALKARFAELSFIPTKSNPEQFRRLIREDLTKIGKAVKEADIRIDF